MTNRLMTPFCFASVMAAMLFAEGALADSFQNASAASKDSAEASGARAVKDAAAPQPGALAQGGWRGQGGTVSGDVREAAS